MTAAMTSVRRGGGADAPCPTNKIRYTTTEEAAEAMASARALRSAGIGNGKVESRMYLCLLCAGWHLTSGKIIGKGAPNPRRGARRRDR
jgi:hypothetical protein